MSTQRAPKYRTARRLVEAIDVLAVQTVADAASAPCVQTDREELKEERKSSARIMVAQAVLLHEIRGYLNHRSYSSGGAK